MVGVSRLSAEMTIFRGRGWICRGIVGGGVRVLRVVEKEGWKRAKSFLTFAHSAIKYILCLV